MNQDYCQEIKGPFFDVGRLVTALIVKVKVNLLEWPKINLSTFSWVPILQANLLNQPVVRLADNLFLAFSWQNVLNT